MRFSYIVSTSLIVSIALLTSSCGPTDVASNSAVTSDGRIKDRSDEDAALSAALAEARKTATDGQFDRLSEHVAPEKKLGVRAVERLTAKAADSSLPSADRLAALLLLGALRDRAKSAATTLVVIERDANDEQVRRFAAQALARIYAAQDYEDSESDLTLPNASAAVPLFSDGETFYIDIDKDGQYFVRARQLTRDELQAEIRRVRNNDPAIVKVAIRADVATPFAFVVAVAGMCQAEGISDYQTVTRQEVPQE